MAVKRMSRFLGFSTFANTLAFVVTIEENK